MVCNRKFLFGAMLAVLLFSGCGNNTSKDSLSYTQDINSFDSSSYIVKKDTSIDIEGNNTKFGTVTISKGTTFTNSDGDIITDKPTLDVDVQKDKTTNSMELSFLCDNQKVIPSKLIKVKLSAPSMLKSGDKVKIDIVNSKDSNLVSQKLIVLTVNSDGTVDVSVVPDLFEDRLVVLIIVKALSNSTD